MEKNFFHVRSLGAWYRFRVEIGLNINLKLLLLPLWLLMLLVAYLAEAIWWGIQMLVKGIMWLAKKVWLVLLAIWAWLLGLFNKKSQPSATTESNWKRWFLLLLLLLLALGGGYVIYKYITKPTPEPIEEVITVEEQVAETVESVWDDVLVARIYLDYKGADNAGGLKYVKGEKAKKITMEQLANIIDVDWKKLVKDNVKVVLTKQQMTTTILLAMRMGQNGFPKSKFLELINKGDFDEATEHIVLYDASGRERKNVGTEQKQYLRVLRLMWEEQLYVSEMMDFHHHSYKAVPLTVSDQKCLDMLTENPVGALTVREILETLE